MNHLQIQISSQINLTVFAPHHFTNEYLSPKFPPHPLSLSRGEREAKFLLPPGEGGLRRSRKTDEGN